jgi:hypothetical protein
MTADEVKGLYGTTPFMQSRTNVTDVKIPYSSSPTLGDFLTGQNVSALYNAWGATAQCVVCAVQVSLLAFPDAAAATAGHQKVEEVNRAIFQNVTAQPPPGAFWDAGFCQSGTFTSGAQTLNWLFCAMRKGTGAITVSVGGFNYDPKVVGDAVRAYAARVEAILKGSAASAPAPAAAGAPASSGPTLTAQQAAASATSRPAATATPPAAGNDTAAKIRSAVPAYVTAVKTADGTYVVAHLHPTATRFYGEQVCRDFFSRLGADPTFAIQIDSINGPASWTWQIYGQTVGTIPDAYTLNVTITQRGASTKATVHFAWDAQRNELLVFSPCVRPPG